MKKSSLFPAISALLLVIAVLASYLHWARSTFMSREIKRRTGAVEVHVVYEVHSETRWYGKAEIDLQTGQRLLAEYKWEHGFNKKIALASMMALDGPPDCSDCFYRILQNSHDAQFHPYPHTVYVLSPSMKVLEVYEVFGA